MQLEWGTGPAACVGAVARPAHRASPVRPARYRPLLACRHITGAARPSRPNLGEMKRTCDSLMEALWEDNQPKECFEQAGGLVVEAAEGDMHRDNMRTEPFAERPVELLAPALPS